MEVIVCQCLDRFVYPCMIVYTSFSSRFGYTDTHIYGTSKIYC